MEHRHVMVRGLRHWCAVVAWAAKVDTPMVGESIERACAWLEAYAPDLSPDDQRQLRHDLRVWLDRAWSMLDQAPPEKGAHPWERLPMGAWEQTVTVKTAAEVLGCTVRTIRRRVAAEDRAGGRLLLRDALGRCGDCGQPYGMCDHTRCEHCGLILGQCAHAART